MDKIIEKSREKAAKKKKKKTVIKETGNAEEISVKNVSEETKA